MSWRSRMDRLVYVSLPGIGSINQTVSPTRRIYTGDHHQDS
jgi:hypothetical protein